MKVTKTIKIDKLNIEEIKSLECTDRLEYRDDDTIMVFLKSEFTKGRKTLSNGDFLCKFESGLWQRFGAEALARTLMNPAKEGGRQWSE